MRRTLLAAAAIAVLATPAAAQSTTKLAPVPPRTSEVAMKTSTVANGFSAIGDLR